MLYLMPCGKSPLELVHFIADQARRFQRVGTGQLIQRQSHRWLTVERASLIVTLRAKFDFGDVAHSDDPPVGARFQDHRAELVDVGEPAERWSSCIETSAHWAPGVGRFRRPPPARFAAGRR